MEIAQDMLSTKYRNNRFGKILLFESVCQTPKQKDAFNKHGGKSRKMYLAHVMK